MMNSIAIIKSRHLIDNEGENSTSKSSGYQDARHNRGLTNIVKIVESYNLSYFIWDENDLKEEHLLSKGVKSIIIPEMRVCSEATFQVLLNLAANGMIVFTTIDSFFYDRNDSLTAKRVLEVRLKELFQLTNESKIITKKFVDSKIVFNKTRFHWITDGLASSLKYDNAWALYIIGDSKKLITHGLIEVNQSTEKEFQGKTFPAFLIREFKSGGLFIYSCFSLREKDNSKQIIRNIAQRESDAINSTSQVRILRMIILVLTGIIGLLLAKEIISDSWPVYIGGLIAGTVLGVLCNKLTTLIERWISGKK